MLRSSEHRTRVLLVYRHSSRLHLRISTGNWAYFTPRRGTRLGSSPWPGGAGWFGSKLTVDPARQPRPAETARARLPADGDLVRAHRRAQYPASRIWPGREARTLVARTGSNEVLRTGDGDTRTRRERRAELEKRTLCGGNGRRRTPDAAFRPGHAATHTTRAGGLPPPDERTRGELRQRAPGERHQGGRRITLQPYDNYHMAC